MTSALTHASGIRRRTTPRVRRRLPRRLITLALAEDRRTTIGFAALFAIVAYIQPVAYRNAYATLAERLAFARSFAGNKALLMFYGEPHDLLTVGGYSAWRVGGTLALFAGGWGLLAATGRLRGEEESGRTEIVLSTVVSRGTGYAAALTARGRQASPSAPDSLFQAHSPGKKPRPATSPTSAWSGSCPAWNNSCRR